MPMEDMSTATGEDPATVRLPEDPQHPRVLPLEDPQLAHVLQTGLRHRHVHQTTGPLHRHANPHQTFHHQAAPGVAEEEDIAAAGEAEAVAVAALAEAGAEAEEEGGSQSGFLFW